MTESRKSPGFGKLPQLLVHLYQLVFFLMLMIQLDTPFLSAHNERQNQTFDMSRHVFRDGWTSVVTPKVSYTSWNFINDHYTAVLQEFPFHGLIGWPVVKCIGHERAVTRLISAAFGLISIQLIYAILCCWLPPVSAAFGAFLWATAPLTLHFGQVPMPDIISTAGLLAAFLFSLRGKPAASSGAFLFALLAKASVIVFGLPVLVALFVARQCRSWDDFFRVAIFWGMPPLLGLLGWGFVLYHFAPPTDMSVLKIVMERGFWGELRSPYFYKFLLGCLVPFGVGVAGLAGLFFSWRKGAPIMNAWCKWSIVASNLVYLLFIVRKIPEPQYLLQPLAWLVIASAFGADFIFSKPGPDAFPRMALASVLVLHLMVAAFFTMDLKSSRAPDFQKIEEAAKLIPSDARVLVVYQYYGASPAVWLDRNVLALANNAPMDVFVEKCGLARKAGFTHLLVLDVMSRHGDKSMSAVISLKNELLGLFHKNPGVFDASGSGGPSPANSCQGYCDRTFPAMLVSEHVRLYFMPAIK